MDGFFYAVNAADGSLAWQHETMDQILGSANWIGDDIIVGSYDSSLYCFAADSGELRWSYATGDRLNGTPAVAGGRIYVGGCDAVLHVVDARKGEKLATVPMGDACHIAASVAVVDGQVYLGHYGNEFVRVDLEKESIVWRYSNHPHPFFAEPAVGAGRVLFGSRDKHLHCVDQASGELLWKAAARRKIDTAPVICGDKVVFASGDGRLRVASLEDGTVLWSHDLGKPILGSPAVAHGRIVTGASDGILRAFGPPSP